MTTTSTQQKCGYVALIGAPNAGKSSLLNALIGEKLAIVTPKVQTTRTQMRGVLTTGDHQIVFIDTPGLFEAQTSFDRRMIGQALMAMEEADACLLLVDACKKSAVRETEKLLARMQKSFSARRLYLVLTKIDLMAKPKLLPLIAQLSALHPFEGVFLVSSTKKDGLVELVKTLNGILPDAPHMFGADDLTDQTTQLTAAEFVREQIFLNLHQEIPYGLAVQTRHIERLPDGSLDMQLDILVADDRHKGMVIGKGGATLERIGTHARLTLQETLGERIHTRITVRTHTKWQTDPDVLHDIGFME